MGSRKHLMRFGVGLATALCVAGSSTRTIAAEPSDKAAATTRNVEDADRQGDEGDDQVSLKQRWIDRLPPAIGNGLDVDVWGWAADLQTLGSNPLLRHNYYDLELGLGVTKSFAQRLTLSGQVNFIDANGEFRTELEQLYGSARVSDAYGTVLTVGRFNANFGSEGRDFWDRRTSTPSLLFAAQPQDLLGLQIRQPIGNTGVSLRPFITEDFQGGHDFNQSPSGGLSIEYQPNRYFDCGVTNFVGPGYVLFGGRRVQAPFRNGAYGSDPQGAVVENWQGPNLTAQRAGTLYFLEVQAAIRPTTDLTLSAEYLTATSGTKYGRWGWSGFFAMADYQFTDELHGYGRWSYLNDSDWLVTGTFQKAQELSIGVGYKLLEGLELRGEYRHDFSNATPDFDSVSIHLSFSY